MEITVNQQHHYLDTPCSVEQLLCILQVPAPGIAVAINQNIVAKASWALHVLKDGDQVMLIKASQGG